MLVFEPCPWIPECGKRGFHGFLVDDGALAVERGFLDQFDVEKMLRIAQRGLLDIGEDEVRPILDFIQKEKMVKTPGGIGCADGCLPLCPEAMACRSTRVVYAHRYERGPRDHQTTVLEASGSTV